MKSLAASAVLLAGLVAAAPAGAQEAPARYSRGMVIAETVMEVTGGFGLLISTPYTISAATCRDDCGDHDVSLWPMMVASGALVTAGIPIIVVGMMPVEADEAGEIAPTVALNVRLGGLGIEGSF